MRQVSIRELRQNASQWLRLVQQGERFEITDRGRPVAMLVPMPKGSILEHLIATGQATPPKRPWNPDRMPHPPKPGIPTASEMLEQLRADER